MGGMVNTTTDYRTYTEQAEITLFGRRLAVLDLTREISPEIPVYPGHMKVAMWDHLTHAESKLRLGDSPFRGYAVKGLAMCDHDSTHMDAISHFHPDRRDLSIDAFPIEHCFAEAAWIDVSDVPPRTHITLDRVRRAMDEAGVEGLPDPADLGYPNHRMHAERLVNHTEVVANIDRIPVHSGFTIMIVPLRLVGATGSPVRVFALWEL
jgi:kynurenine formamidase